MLILLQTSPFIFLFRLKSYRLPILFSTIMNHNFRSLNHNRIFIFRVHFSMCAHFCNRRFAPNGKVHLLYDTSCKQASLSLANQPEKFILIASLQLSLVHTFPIELQMNPCYRFFLSVDLFANSFTWTVPW